MHKLSSGISQAELAAQSGASWYQVQKLVARGAVVPVAIVGNMTIFSPDAVEIVKAAMADGKPSAEVLSAWEKLSAKERGEFGNSIKSFGAFKRQEGSFQSFQNGRSIRASFRKGAA
jgi:hypothetical protein